MLGREACGSTWSGRISEHFQDGSPGVRDLWVKAHQALVNRVLAKAWAELGNLRQVMALSVHRCLFGDQRIWTTQVSSSFGSRGNPSWAQTAKFYPQFQAVGAGPQALPKIAGLVALE